MIHYNLASSTWDSEEINAIESVIQKGMFTMSGEVRKFETSFAEYLGSKYAVMVNSGSSANLLGIAAFFYLKSPLLKAGDEVIVPAVSWATTYFPLHQYGLKLKFVDIDLDTLNFNLHELQNAISEKTKMIVAVNLLGNPNDFQRIRELIKARKIILFEDNCESLGATFQGKQTGTFGRIGTFSTFFSHHISTMEGGMIVTDDEELYHILLSIRSHGWTRHLPHNNSIIEKQEDTFSESFRFILPGYNLRPLEFSGAIGLCQLSKLDDFLAVRRNNAAYFIEKFQHDPHFRIQKEIGKSSWFGFSLIIQPDAQIERDAVIRKLESSKIETRPIVSGDFTKNEVIKYFNYEISGALPNAKYLDENGFFVGNHHIDISREIDHLYATLQSLLR